MTPFYGNLVHLTLWLVALSCASFLCFLAATQIYHHLQVKKLSSKPSYFPRAESSFAVVDGYNLHYLKAGHGPSLLLLHGLGANIYCWRKLIPLLSEDYTVWAVDLKGFGLSDKPKKSSYTLKSQGELLVHFMERQKIKKFTVIGNSMGGAIAAQIGIDRPDLVDHIVLINSAHDSRVFDGRLRTFTKLMKLVSPAARFFSPMINEQTVAYYLPKIYGNKEYKVSPEDVRAYAGPYMKGTESHLAFVASLEGLLWNDIATNLKKIQSKVLILCGAFDNLLYLKSAETLHDELPQSTYLVHPGGGHHLQEEEPQWVADQIKSFFQKLS